MKSKTAKRPPAEARPKPRGPKVAPVRGRLLLVEDHEPTRTGLRLILESRNFNVKCAATVAEAWSLAGDHSFDLLISDIGLPDGDGYLLMRELRDRHSIKGIALTGFGLDDDIKLSEEAGFSAHIVKPFTAKCLDEALAKLGI
jgi:DNA-binding response OmpR family regulator